MNEVMTWEEIEEAFDGEWVLIEDPELTRSLEIVGGKVVFHSAERKEVYKRMRELPELCHAVRYIGKLPQDMVFAL